MFSFSFHSFLCVLWVEYEMVLKEEMDDTERHIEMDDTERHIEVLLGIVSQK